MFPSLKPTVQRNDLNETVFLRTSARVTEIDYNSIYYDFLSRCDGKTSLNDIILSLTKDGHSQDDISNTIKDFDDLLLLEDHSITNQSLTQAETDRWARNLNFFGSFLPLGEDKYQPQKALRDCKITLLGLGGLGSHLLYDLAALGCKDILAVEFDRVETSNLNRQILYTPNDIGRLKARIAADRIHAFSPELSFSVFDQKIEKTEDVRGAISGRDLVICVADRPKTEILHWVNEAVVFDKIPLITGGLDTQVARYYCTLPDQGCLECWRRAIRINHPNQDALLEEQRRTQLRGDNAAFVPFVAIITGLIIADLVKIVTGIGGPPNGLNNTREIDFHHMTIETRETWEKDASCTICGP